MTGPHLVVAMPARDEEAHIGAALAAVEVAAARLREAEPGAAVTVVVAADASTDGTAGIALAAGAAVVLVDGGVGAARSAAVEHALAVAPAACWIANTDADSRVPPDWLLTHLAAERAGVDVLLGSVRPDGQAVDAALLATWLRRNPPQEQHGFVHGANLGVRPSAYRVSGGFAAVRSDEDVLLVARCRELGLVVRSTDRDPVLTSARLTGRAPAGFSAHLRGLLAETPHPA